MFILHRFFYIQIGTCVGKDAHPAAELTWTRNGKPLVADGKGAVPCFLGLPKCNQQDVM